MRVLVLSDLHLGQYPEGIADVLDMELELDTLDRILDVAEGEGVEGVLLLGDILHSWTYRYSFVLLEMLRKKLSGRRLPAVVIRGNHEPLPSDPVYMAFSNGMFWFVTGGEEDAFAMRLSELSAPGAVGDFLKGLEGAVAVPFPVKHPAGPRQATDAIRDVLSEGDVIFAHYFVDGYMPPGDNRFIFPIKGHLIIGGHQHAHTFNPEKGAVIVGSMLPRDYHANDSLVHFGIYDTDTGEYTPYSFGLPYALIRNMRVKEPRQFVEDLKALFEEKPHLKKVLIWRVVARDPDVELGAIRELEASGLEDRVAVKVWEVATVGDADGEDEWRSPDVKDIFADVGQAFAKYLEMLRQIPSEMRELGITEEDLPALLEEFKAIVESVSSGGENA